MVDPYNLEREGIVLASIFVNPEYALRGNEREIAKRLAQKGLVKIVEDKVSLTVIGEDIAEGIVGAVLDFYSK